MTSSRCRRYFLGLRFLILLPCLGNSHAQTKTTAKTQIVLLGTGTPLPDPERSGPCTAIIVNGTPYLVDFGTRLVRRAAAARNKGVNALEPVNLKIVFITHLHADHTLGFADIILTPWIMGRKEPLEVYGPERRRWPIISRRLTRSTLRTELRGWSTPIKPGHKVNVYEINPGIVYRDENVTVKAFDAHHGQLPQTFGFASLAVCQDVALRWQHLR